MRASCSVLFSVRMDSVRDVDGLNAPVDVAVSWAGCSNWVWRARRVEGKSLSWSDMLGAAGLGDGTLGIFKVMGEVSCGVKASGEDGSSVKSGGVSSPRTSSSESFSSASGTLSCYTSIRIGKANRSKIPSLPHPFLVVSRSVVLRGRASVIIPPGHLVVLMV